MPLGPGDRVDVYLNDAISERRWVEDELCKGLWNVLTAFPGASPIDRLPRERDDKILVPQPDP